MPEIPNDLITLETARAETGKTWPTLRYWIRSGKLQGWKQGHYVKVSRAELLAIVAEQDIVQPLPPSHHREEIEQANGNQTG